MTPSARDLLDTARRQLEPDEDANRLVPLIATGQAPRTVLAALAAEQHHVITSDWRSFLTLAARSETPAGRELYTSLAQGETLALSHLRSLAAACDLDQAALDGYEPQAGCQAYPAYLAWLALNAHPTEALIAIVANFTAWGTYCATIAAALRRHYGFDDRACAFFDLFATPSPELEQQALAAVEAGLDDRLRIDRAHRYGRLLQSYELMFWRTLEPH
jgi:TENA/THI-4/PQQC family